MKRPLDAHVIAILQFGNALIALSSDGSLWSSMLEIRRDMNGDEFLWIQSEHGNGWKVIDGPFDFDPSGNEWDDDEDDEDDEAERVAAAVRRATPSIPEGTE